MKRKLVYLPTYYSKDIVDDINSYFDKGYNIEGILDDFMFLTYGGNILKAGNANDARNESGKTLDELFREVFKC